MFQAEITGDREVIRSFGRVDAAVRSELVAGIGRLALRLLTRVKARKLSGQVLNVRTGRLRRSINQRVTDTGSTITGTVGTNVSYGRVHEYGDQRVITVKQHLRLVKQAWGRPLAKPRRVMVSSHARQQNMPARSFLRSALRELAAEGVIDRELASAVARAAKRV